MRTRCEQDGRGVDVTLTADGRKVVEAALPYHVDNEHRLLASLSAERREQLAAILSTLIRALDVEELSGKKNPLAVDQVDVLGSAMGSPPDFRDLMDHVTRHGLTPVVDSVHALEHVAAAYRRLDSEDRVGQGHPEPARCDRALRPPAQHHPIKEPDMIDTGAHQVLQMRLVVEADDYEEAVRFYRDVLGADEELQVHGDDGEKVTILQVGRATLELSNPAQVAYIDEVEVGRPVSPRLRVAFEVRDAGGTTQRLLEAGASLVAPPTETPWNSLNSRLQAPGGLQITVFQEPDAP